MQTRKLDYGSRVSCCYRGSRRRVSASADASGYRLDESRVAMRTRTLPEHGPGSPLVQLSAVNVFRTIRRTGYQYRDETCPRLKIHLDRTTVSYDALTLPRFMAAAAQVQLMRQATEGANRELP